MKKNCRINIEENGFTLVEIIVVIVIIGIGIVPILNYFSNSIGFINDTEIRSQAATIAGDVIEMIKDKTTSNWDYLDEFDNTTVNDTKEMELFGDISSDYDFLADFSLDVQVKPFTFIESFTEVENEDIGREIEVIISWESGGKSESVSTLIRNRTGDNDESS
ncbi:prepilin-type N-terminal cleavage/methylation domain-containing protein [Halanaerobium sp.]|uniref:prepilin-type N-terminal cleavage/methylation domain-containing protein n=1 Tax=Halanaerobium sp. TaxID=1895664 RepID=UPI000DE6B08A|nr:prepilin-type N-terminal cleavage/methylation domain-containing protein [Halanaerobium sp.]PUU93331.1 MAG: hypothetical protein CI949_1369 [Halanaerobium sp.]